MKDRKWMPSALKFWMPKNEIHYMCYKNTSKKQEIII